GTPARAVSSTAATMALARSASLASVAAGSPRTSVLITGAWYRRQVPENSRNVGPGASVLPSQLECGMRGPGPVPTTGPQAGLESDARCSAAAIAAPTDASLAPAAAAAVVAALTPAAVTSAARWTHRSSAGERTSLSRSTM